MSTAKHSPAPWKRHRSVSGGIVVRDANDKGVCRLLPYDNEKNAAVIESAPQLLAALKECVERLKLDYPADNKRILQAQAAIDKAEGYTGTHWTND